MRETPNWPDPAAHIARHQPDTALLYFSPAALQAVARRFRAGFDGLVTYAVKANAEEEVLANLVAAGIRAFDVASPREMYAVRAVCPDAVLHYNNPVRSPEEVAVAHALGVASASVDCARELEKLSALPKSTEITVRLALPVAGAAYDFGEKFGVGPERAETLLREVAARGFVPSITFHPGTQCADPSAWGSYIAVAADVARAAGVRLARLNVGGGFASHRGGTAPDLEAVFDHIRAETLRCFGADAPDLVCEPGRAMVADAFSLAARVKALRENGSVFLNDGIYGGLTEIRDIGAPERIRVVSPEGALRHAPPVARVVFGPTCDSIDRLPDALPLPGDMEEGDFVLFDGMGAYSRSLTTRFNGYGLGGSVTVASLT
ncbi:type III PLP-dependent enzyme [Roseovarius sp. EGI FJ00037]|uniref:type III PLP-dependent enzyme n=1 Tax=Roseovarius TaxID=74030 RepID=UPI0022A8448C|nr:type III PLP-dependent enzyme [Roseovarius sp. EGI FJ00037]MCZ0811804.1 type III PLP-dependent enzyme [Roseovarius sp. EGI FJ00037]